MTRLGLLSLPVLLFGFAFVACGDDADDEFIPPPGTPTATNGADTTPADPAGAPSVDDVKDALVAGGAPSETYAECVAERVVAQVHGGELDADDLRAWVDGVAPMGPAQDAIFAAETSGECTP